MKSYIQRMKEIERGRTEYYQSLGTPPGLPTMKGHYSEPEETNRPLPNIVLGNYDVPKNWPTPPKSSEPGAPPGPPIQWQPNTPQTAASGYGYVPAAEPEREVFFYHSDHLGSTAYITDRNGAVSQFICYMPYGEALVDEHSSSTEEQPYKFNGKEMDRETGLYYYGARYYDPSKSGVWYGIDPLTEKYPALSPYSYCAGNPVRYVDPDGRKLVYATGTSSSFKKDVIKTIEFMNQKGTSAIIRELMNHPKTITIKESYKTTFDPATNTINWNPTLGILTEKDKILSPATALNHEADHALQSLVNPLKKAEDLKSTDQMYKNKEERRVITGSEQETARKHGEIKNNEVTRKGHSGFAYETKGPITTEGKNEVVISNKK